VYSTQLNETAFMCSQEIRKLRCKSVEILYCVPTVEWREVAKRDTDPFKPFQRTSKQKKIFKRNYKRIVSLGRERNSSTEITHVAIKLFCNLVAQFERFLLLRRSEHI
jgi:hypothetical protein